MDIINYLQLDENELFILVAEEVYTNIGAINKDKGKLKKLGESYFNKKIREICDKLNDNDLVGSINSEKNKDKLFILIADTITSMGLGIPVLSIAALIVKIGIENLC